MKYTKAEIAEATEKLRGWLKPGDTVYTILRNVSRSGMSRDISVLVKLGGDFIHPNHAVAVATRSTLKTGWHDSIRMGGAGMDMGFALVYNLSHALFPTGFECIGDRCPSNDHSNGDRSYEPGAHAQVETGLCPTCNHYGDDCTGNTANHHHQEGGYALRHQWL